MLQITYASAAVAPFSEFELAQLLRHARVKNARLDVTGMLLYHEGSFLQVIEGDARVVEALFATIGCDPRHSRVLALLRREIEARHFGDWAMGFVSPKHFTARLPGYSEYLSHRSQPEKSATAAEQLLGAFRDGRFRSYVTGQ